MQHLDQHQKLEEVVNLFSKEGWKIFQEEIKAQCELATEFADGDCITNDQWQFRRGELKILRSLMNYEQYIRNTLDHLNAPIEENPDVDCL